MIGHTFGFCPWNQKLENFVSPNEWSHFRVLSIESNVRKLCIAESFTLGVEGLRQFIANMQRLLDYILFTLANARRFHASVGDPREWKG